MNRQNTHIRTDIMTNAKAHSITDNTCRILPPGRQQTQIKSKIAKYQYRPHTQTQFIALITNTHHSTAVFHANTQQILDFFNICTILCNTSVYTTLVSNNSSNNKAHHHDKNRHAARQRNRTTAQHCKQRHEYS